MGYTYIGKALGVMSRAQPSVAHLDLTERLAARLGGMGTIDLSLTDTAASFIGEGSRDAQTKDWRRAAIVLKKAFPTEARQVQNAINPRIDTTATWVVANLQNYVQRFTAVAPAVATGFYLKGSFWAYATPAEREQARLAGPEATRMLDAALRAHLNAGLRVKWFGDTPLTTITAHLTTLRTAITGQSVGICYQGIGARTNAAAARINERGHGGQGGAGQVGFADVWGSSAIGAGSVCLGAKFFARGETHASRTAQHTVTDLDSDVTRAGALIHEMAHRYLAAIDVPLAGAVRAAVQARRTSQLPADARAYGPVACHALARLTPADAIRNADNFRHFCEDAFILYRA